MNKVFSLVLQEERQRGLSISGSSLNLNTTALLTKTAPAPHTCFKNHPKSKVLIVESQVILWRNVIDSMVSHPDTSSQRAKILFLLLIKFLLMLIIQQCLNCR